MTAQRMGNRLLFFIKKYSAVGRIVVDRADDAVRTIWLLQVGDILIRKPDCECGCGVIQISGPCGSDNGGSYTLGPVLCKSDFGHFYAGFLGQRMNAGNDLHILFFRTIIFSHSDSVCMAAKRVRVPGGTSQMSGGQRTVRHQRDIHLAANGDQLPFIFAV